MRVSGGEASGNSSSRGEVVVAVEAVYVGVAAAQPPVRRGRLGVEDYYMCMCMCMCACACTCACACACSSSVKVVVAAVAAAVVVVAVCYK